MDENKLLLRSEIAPEDTWAIEDLYASDSEWEAAFKEAEGLLGGIGAYAGRLGESADTLLDCVKGYYAASRKLERLIVYSNQRYHVDTADETYQALSQRAQRLSVQFSEAAAYIEPELLSLDPAKLEGFLLADNGIGEYRHAIEEMVRNREHVLSREMEELLSSAGEISEAPDDIYSAFTNADLQFPDITDKDGNAHKLTDERYAMYLRNNDRVLRKSAFDNLWSVYDSYKNTISAIFSANLKSSQFSAKARKFKSTREQALFFNRVPENVYDSLIDSVHKSLPLMHKYISLRKKALKLDELHMYDIYVPIVGDLEIKMSYAEAKELVYDALEPMGDEYRAVLKKGFDNRWIDVYENKGKRGGAYSWGAYGVHPYVFLNHKNNLDSAFTLAHEMGHALHSYFSDEALPYHDAGYRIFVAEVASTCNEALLTNYLLSGTDDREKRLYYLNHFLESFRGTVFRQTMFAEFERDVHALSERGEALTSSVISDMYIELNRKYYGPDIISDESIKYEWMRIPHFYTPFYVYQYSTGFAAAIALSRRILNEGRSAVEDYMKFLSGGASKDPIDLLRLAGVDMASPKPVDMAMEYFGELLDEMEKELLG